jgi:hypothetical protein
VPDSRRARTAAGDAERRIPNVGRSRLANPEVADCGVRCGTGRVVVPLTRWGLAVMLEVFGLALAM